MNSEETRLKNILQKLKDPQLSLKECKSQYQSAKIDWDYTFDKALEKEELKEKDALLEKKVVELQQINQELEEALELEVETSECHLEALEVARQWKVRQSKEKDDNLEKALKKIEMLENVVAWQNYLADKQLQELPSLPKKERKFKLLINKVKNRIKQVKEITREKFNAYILQKSK